MRQKPRRMRSGPFGMALLGMALLGMALLGMALLAGCGDRDAGPARAGQRDAGDLTAGEPDVPDLVHRRSHGGYVAVIAARGAADVATEVGGQIAAVNVELGDRVPAGQLIATIDDRIAREDLAVAVAAQRAAQAARDSARVEVEETASRLETERSLAAQGTTARADLERAVFAHEKARAAAQRAEAALAEQMARVTQLRARVTSARVEAPYAGTVSMRYLDPGATVAPGTPIIRLIASDELWVKFAVPSEDAAYISAGTPVVVEIESASIRVDAMVRHVAPELEPASQMIIAEAELALDEQTRDRVKAGLAARVHLAARPETAP
jgi:RND family efflux transporter MFP subunit